MLIRVCRTNFGEIFQTWLHIKALRVFVESILRYGLPPDFQGMTVRPKPRYERKVRDLMAQLYAKLGSSLAKGNKNEPMEDIQGVMYDKEYLPFVCFELQWDY
jgi:V-type H+-transporting ATPase subunit C